MTASYTVTSSLAMIELFYSKIYTVDALSLWENTWLMSFNSSKCYILCMNRSKVKPTVNYFLDGQPLSLVDSHDTYLGITISSDWHWQNRTSSICAMASRIVNFVRRNIYGCSAEAKATAYTTLVRPLLEFSSAAWDLHSAKDVHQLECVQRRADRFVMNDYRRTTSATNLLNQLEWSPLSVRRRNSCLVAFYKAVNNLSPVPVGQPRPCSYQTRSYDPLTFTPLTHQPTTTSTPSYRTPLSIGTRCHSHYEPSRRLIHSVQVSSTSLSLHHLTEQNHNTPAVTGHAHSWILQLHRQLFTAR